MIIMKKIASMFGLIFLTAFPGQAEEEVSIIDRRQTEHYLRSGAVFIDNRPEEKFAHGHIEGAVLTIKNDEPKREVFLGIC